MGMSFLSLRGDRRLFHSSIDLSFVSHSFSCSHPVSRQPGLSSLRAWGCFVTSSRTGLDDSVGRSHRCLFSGSGLLRGIPVEKHGSTFLLNIFAVSGFQYKLSCSCLNGFACRVVMLSFPVILHVLFEAGPMAIGKTRSCCPDHHRSPESFVCVLMPVPFQGEVHESGRHSPATGSAFMHRSDGVRHRSWFRLRKA